MGLAAQPRRRRPQPEDRVEPDAHQQRAAEARSTSSLRGRSPRSMPADRRRPPARRLVRRDGAREAGRPGVVPLHLARPEGVVAAGAGDPRLPDPRRHPRGRGVPASEARYAAAFYNAWFLDHDAGAVYFNVLASGIPYLLGTERLKGSHSMSAYHNTELCYLAAVYTNLLHHAAAARPLLQAARGRRSRTASSASRPTSSRPARSTSSRSGSTGRPGRSSTPRS